MMVALPGVQQSIPTRWHGTPDARALDVRWQEQADRLEKLGHAPILPIVEDSVYQMRQIWLQATQQIADDPARRAASLQLTELLNRHTRNLAALAKLRARVPALLNDPVHQLLNDVPKEWNVDLPPVRDQTGSNATTGEMRAEHTRLLPIMLAVEDLVARLDQAVAIDQGEAATLHKMILKLFARHLTSMRETMQRLNAQTERIGLLEAKIDRIGKAVRRRNSHA
jgi:hypothetical protein